jgi:hypothetical protein
VAVNWCFYYVAVHVAARLRVPGAHLASIADTFVDFVVFAPTLASASNAVGRAMRAGRQDQAR